jgi:hypothetical protein
MAARLVFKARKFCHITPILQQLDWLPVQKRIDEKILKITFKSQTGLCPSYLSELISRKPQSRSLWSADEYRLSTPFFRLRTVGDRSFCSAGPRLWNDLPLCLRDFSLIRSDANHSTSFSTHLRSFLKSTYYSGLSAASSFLQSVALVGNVGYRMRTESPLGSVYAIENSPA